MTFPSGARLGSYEWNGDRWVWSPTLKDFQVGTAYLPGPAEAPNLGLFRPAPALKSKQAADAWWEEEMRLVQGAARKREMRRALSNILTNCRYRGSTNDAASDIIALLIKKGML